MSCEEKLALAISALQEIVGKPAFADDPWGIAAKALEALKGNQ